MKTILAALYLTSGLHRSLSSLTIGALAYLCWAFVIIARILVDDTVGKG